MPCIKCQFNQKLNAEKKEAVKEGLCEAIELIPGKKADGLMIVLEDEQTMYFHKTDDIKVAYVEVNMLLRADPSEHFPAMSAKLCDLFHKELDIAPDCVYIRYTATKDWGWNGKNF